MAAPVEQQTTGKKVADADEAMRTCAAVETELAELRAAYDQYFLGVERKPPTKRHDALKKQMSDLKSHFVRQTSVRFRIDNLAQKLTTFERLWDRTLKEIEAGTYKRHLFKAKLHATAKTQPAKKVEDPHDSFDVDEDLDVSDLGPEAPTNPDLASALTAAAMALSKPIAPVIAPVARVVPAVSASAAPTIPAVAPVVAKPASAISRPAAAPVAKAPAAGTVPPGGLSDQKIKAIYDAYVMAKRRCGEDTSKLSLNAVADTLKKQVPALMKQHQAKSVEFKVVIKDGKAVLRALPKE